MKTIICVGDSNTFGYDPRNFWGGRYDHSWPELLGAELGCRTVNLGENGRMIPDEFEAEFLDRAIRRYLPADRILVMLGTNDILNAMRPNEQIITNRMEDYLEHLRAEFPAVRLILVAPPAVAITERGMDKASKRLCGCYKNLAQCLGIEFVDADGFGLQLAYDGVHLTEEGHRSFARLLAKALML